MQICHSLRCKLICLFTPVPYRASINKSPRIRSRPISLKTPRRVDQLWQMNLKRLQVWTPASGGLKRLSRTRTCNFSDPMLTNHKYSQLRILLLPPLCRCNLAFFYLMSSWTVSRFVSHISLSYGGFFPFPTPKNCARVFMQCFFPVQSVIVRDVARNFGLAACLNFPCPFLAPRSLCCFILLEEFCCTCCAP